MGHVFGQNYFLWGVRGAINAVRDMRVTMIGGLGGQLARVQHKFNAAKASKSLGARGMWATWERTTEGVHGQSKSYGLAAGGAHHGRGQGGGKAGEPEGSPGHHPEPTPSLISPWPPGVGRVCVPSVFRGVSHGDIGHWSHTEASHSPPLWHKNVAWHSQTSHGRAQNHCPHSTFPRPCSVPAVCGNSFPFLFVHLISAQLVWLQQVRDGVCPSGPDCDVSPRNIVPEVSYNCLAGLLYLKLQYARGLTVRMMLSSLPPGLAFSSSVSWPE